MTKIKNRFKKKAVFIFIYSMPAKAGEKLRMTTENNLIKS